MAGSVRLGLIGAGGMASAHLKAIAPMADAEIAALCDVSAEKCAQRAEELFGLGDARIGCRKVDAVLRVRGITLHPQGQEDCGSPEERVPLKSDRPRHRSVWAR